MGELANFLLVDEPGLGDDGSAVLPPIAPSHLPFRIVREGEGFATLTTQGRAVNSAKRPKVGLREELEFVDGAFEKHLGLVGSRESGTVAVIDRQRPYGDLVDRIHPVGSILRTFEDAVGHPEPGLGIGLAGVRVVALTDESDLVAFSRQGIQPPIIETLPIGSDRKMISALTYMAHDVSGATVPDEHVTLVFD